MTFAHLNNLELQLDAGEVLERAYAYLSFRGHVGDGWSSRLPSKEVASEDRQYPRTSVNAKLSR